MKPRLLSLMLAFSLVLTVGGVYATWTYAGTDDIADSYAEAKVTIADAELTGANGTYKIESNLVLVVDQASANHDAKLVFQANDNQPVYLKVTFTPAAHASQSIKDKAVDSELYFGTTHVMQYDNTNIFTFANSGNQELDNLIEWTKEADGSFTYTLDQAALENQIKLTEAFVLDTKAKHDAFRTALSGNIVARVTDGTVTGTN